VATLVPAVPASASRDPDLGKRAPQITRDMITLSARIAELGPAWENLRAEPEPAQPLDALRHALAMEAAGYRYRESIRLEQESVYLLASFPDLEAAVMPRLPAAQVPALKDGIEALRALWRLAEIDEPWLVRVRWNRPHPATTPLATLVSFYKEAATRYGIDWTYLASINFIESDFGRVSNDSTAGAQGPMQFLPSTWAAYGEGDIRDPHASILAAARYLVRWGAPGDMRNAIFHYNLDYDYVEAVVRYASAIRRDPTWLNRYYYWNTGG
jgi:soluble lytic murein transglycosylase-like protein